MRFVVVAGVLIVVADLFAGQRGLPALLQSKRDAMLITAQIAALRSENEALAAQIRALNTDPVTIERVARQTLGLIKPDEVVVRVSQP